MRLLAYDRKTVMVAGKITQAGDIDLTVTSSFAIEDANRDSEGDYTITFQTGTFATTPIVTVTLMETNNGGSSIIAVLTTSSPEGFHVKIKGLSGTDRNAPFNFIAIGER